MTAPVTVQQRTARVARAPRAVLSGVLAVVVVATTGWLLVRAAGVDAVGVALTSLAATDVLAVVALELAALAALAQVYRATFAADGGRLAYRDALTVALGAFSLTQLLPGGGAAGGVFAVRQFRDHGADPVRATTTVLRVGLVTMGTLGVVVSVATTIAALGTDGYGRYATISLLGTALVLGGFAILHLLTARPALRDRVVAAVARLRWRGRPVARDWVDGLARHQGLLHRPGRLAGPVGWSALKWFLDLGILALLLQTFGAGAPLLAVLVAFAVANLLNGLPLLPGGAGLVEIGLAGTLLAFGSAPAATSLAVLAYRAVASWLPVVVAAPVVTTGMRRVRRARLSTGTAVVGAATGSAGTGTGSAGSAIAAVDGHAEVWS